jgi:hypothetical protein
MNLIALKFPFIFNRQHKMFYRGKEYIQSFDPWYLQDNEGWRALQISVLKDCNSFVNFNLIYFLLTYNRQMGIIILKIICENKMHHLLQEKEMKGNIYVSTEVTMILYLFMLQKFYIHSKTILILWNRPRHSGGCVDYLMLGSDCRPRILFIIKNVFYNFWSQWISESIPLLGIWVELLVWHAM